MTGQRGPVGTEYAAGLLALLLLVAACGGASPATTPAPAATPVPAVVTAEPEPEPELVGGSGIITFGTSVDEETLLIPKPLTRFKRTYPEIHWSANFSEPAGATTLLIVLSRVSSGGAEVTVYSEETDVTSPEFDLFSASADLAGLADNKAGTYTLRYIRDDTVLAEGTFTLVK